MTLRQVDTFQSEFDVGPPAGTGQRTSYGPPAVVRRARRSNIGLVNIGLGGRAREDPNSIMILPQVHLEMLVLCLKGRE